MRLIKSLKILDGLSCSRTGIKVNRRGGGEGGSGGREETGVGVGASGENSVFVSLALSGAHLLMGSLFYWLQQAEVNTTILH